MAHHAMTLVEMMVAMGIFGFVVIGLVYAHLFGLKQDQLVQSKLGASDQSRRGFSQLALDVRSCKSWRIGNGNLAGFEPIPNGAAQVGNALMVYPMTGTNAFVMYYFDTTRRELHRGQSGVADTRLVAQNLTNTMYFRAENYRGEVQTDLSHKGVINVMLQFCQYQYPLTQVGPGHYYDYYKMEFRLTSHVPDGP
jgi:prepilin-type N-terminal cleavage/methylation domain-containing protein